MTHENRSRRSPGPWLAGVVAAILGLASAVAAQEVHVAGIDSARLRGVVQPRFDTSTVDSVAETGWELRRARLMLRMYAGGWIRGDVEADFARGSVQLTDGFVQLDFDPRFQIRLGQFKKPFDTLMLADGREGAPVERDGLPRGAVFPTPNIVGRSLGYSNRDLGAEWRGRFGRATLIGGFWNGSGANRGDEDDGKQVGARAEIAVPGGWRAIAAWAGIRRSAPEDEPDAEGRWSNGFELAATTGRPHEPGFKALLQAMFGDGARRAEEDEDAAFLTLQVLLAHYVALQAVPHLIGVEPIARWGWSDPDDDTDVDEATLWTGGVNLFHHPRVKTMFQVDHVAPAVGDGATAFRVQTSLGF